MSKYRFSHLRRIEDPTRFPFSENVRLMVRGRIDHKVFEATYEPRTKGRDGLLIWRAWTTSPAVQLSNGERIAISRRLGQLMDLDWPGVPERRG